MKTSTQICLTPLGFAQRTPGAPGRRPSGCVCARVCVRSADFNLDYVPYENSMEMENNKNSVEHVQSGESSASVCVCMRVCAECVEYLAIAVLG